MLLQSSIDFITKVRMNMLFDNGKERVFILEKGQYVLIKFRHNGGKYNRLGKIKEILPIAEFTNTASSRYAYDMTPVYVGCKLIVDFGSTFGSSQLTINCSEILNLRILTEEKMKEFLDLGDQLVITDELFDEENDLKPEEPGTGDDTTGDETQTSPGDETDIPNENTGDGENKSDKESTNSGDYTNSNDSTTIDTGGNTSLGSELGGE